MTLVNVLNFLITQKYWKSFFK